MLLKNINFIPKCLFCYLAVILSGCSFKPIYERPLLPTAETYPRAFSETGTNIQQLAWYDYFKDSDLQQLIALALENNRDLAAAIVRISETRALYGFQWANMFPTLSGAAAALRFRSTSDLIPLPSPSPSTSSSVHSESPSSFIFSAYIAAFNVSAWELDFWGRLRNLTEASLELYLASEDAARAVNISLIGQVANLYLIGSELNEQVSIAKKTLETREEALRIMRRRYEEGSSSKLDAIQAETLLLQSRTDLLNYERLRELNWNAMNLLIGIPIYPNYNLLSAIEPYFIEEIAPGLPSELLLNRPDIVAAEHKLRAANANIGAARAAFFPTITLSGGYGSLSTHLRHLLGAGNKFWYYFPTISVPIFDWGRNASDLDLAKALKHEAVIEYEHTIQVAFREVADAMTERLWLAQQMEVEKQTLEAQTERKRLAWIRYDYGTSPYLEYLDAERDRFAAEQALVSRRLAYLTSRVNLYIALGGGLGGDCP